MSEVILAIFLGLGLVVAIILLAPVRVRAVVREGHRRVSVRYLGSEIAVEHPDARWVLRFLGMRIRSGRFAPKPREEAAKARKKPRRVALPPRTSLLHRLALARRQSPVVRRVLRVVLRLVGRLIRSWRLERGRIGLSFGLGDPARTGMFLGYLSALRGILQHRWRRLTLDLSPDFTRSVLHLEADLTLRIIPVQPVYHIIRAVGSIPWLRLWKLKRAWAS